MIGRLSQMKAMSTSEVPSLIDVLQETRRLLESSAESVWSHTTPGQVIALLDREVASLERAGHLTNKSELKLLFGPTAAIQEIAAASGWSDVYLKLAARFDTSVEGCT